MISGSEHRILEEILRRLGRIERILERHSITHFTVRENSMQPFAPGSSPQFTATPQPVPVRTSGDTTREPLVAEDKKQPKKPASISEVRLLGSRAHTKMPEGFDYALTMIKAIDPSTIIGFDFRLQLEEK